MESATALRVSLQHQRMCVCVEKAYPGISGSIAASAVGELANGGRVGRRKRIFSMTYSSLLKILTVSNLGVGARARVRAVRLRGAKRNAIRNFPVITFTGTSNTPPRQLL